MTSLRTLLERSGFRTIEEYYLPCFLPYEMRATGSFSALKSAVRHGDALKALGHAVAASAVVVTYPLVSLIDRMLVSKKRDVYFHSLAARTD